MITLPEVVESELLREDQAVSHEGGVICGSELEFWRAFLAELDRQPVRRT